MRPRRLFIDGIASWTPTLPDWPTLAQALRNESTLPPDTAPQRPSPDLLAANERRRAPESVLMALQVAQQAVVASGQDMAALASIFASAHGHRPDPRRTTVDEQPLSGRQPRRHEDVRPHGAGHLGQRRRVDERHSGGHRQQLARGDGDAGGIPAAGEQRAGLVANGPTGDVRAHRRHSSAALEA